MVDIKFYNFPVASDGYSKIKLKHSELYHRYRTGKKLSREEKDWMDWADYYLSYYY